MLLFQEVYKNPSPVIPSLLFMPLNYINLNLDGFFCFIPTTPGFKLLR